VIHQEDATLNKDDEGNQEGDIKPAAQRHKRQHENGARQ
jgi:hypothetical protein